MNREQVIRMAREAGATPYTNRHYPESPTHTFNPEQLESFAALVAAAEREECAKLCESLFDPDDDSCNEADLCVAAIRARGRQ